MTRSHISEGQAVLGLLGVMFLSGFLGVPWLIVPAFLLAAALL